MSELKELLQVSSKDTLRFFHRGLTEVITTEKVSGRETFYAASILASYAQTSSEDMTAIPPASSLSKIFEHFVLPGRALRDAKLLEAAGAQSLFLLGFFPHQMSRRHNLRWFEELGQLFYKRASECSSVRREQELFGKFSQNYWIWKGVYRKLNKNLYEERFVLPSW